MLRQSTNIILSAHSAIPLSSFFGFGFENVTAFKKKLLGPFGTNSSKCNAVCGGGPMSVAAYPRASGPQPSRMNEKKGEELLAEWSNC